MASAIGTAAPKTGTIHQKRVSEARGTHTAPRTKTYRAVCQLTHEDPPRLGVEPRVPGARLTATSEDRPYLPDRGSLEAAPRRPGSCSRPPSWVRPGASFLDCSIDRTSPFRTCPSLLEVETRPVPSLVRSAPAIIHAGPSRLLFHKRAVTDRICCRRRPRLEKPEGVSPLASAELRRNPSGDVQRIVSRRTSKNAVLGSFMYVVRLACATARGWILSSASSSSGASPLSRARKRILVARRVSGVSLICGYRFLFNAVKIGIVRRGMLATLAQPRPPAPPQRRGER